MKITFKYDLSKDVENFIKSYSSVNNRKPTKLQEKYNTEIGDLDPAKVPAFLSAQGINIEERLKTIEVAWRRIESDVLSRLDKLFETKLTQDLTAYLSTNARCTYNIKENYFFVYMNSKHANGSIVHELLHFYTWHTFQADNDIKESLTEILNTDFTDLLPGYIDNGYPQHKEMRGRIREMRSKGLSLKEIVSDFKK